MALPQVEEGVSCNKASFKAGGKAFLFVGTGDGTTNVMLKLKDSVPAAVRLATAHPATYQIGGHNWVTITLGDKQALPTELPTHWIEESYRLLVPKRVLASQNGQKPHTSRPKARTATKMR